ncbi:MAG: hypothetical protein KDB54_06785 [Solirubrobacterales bacterium]|nr:hypothetical protein [Solirubrobacterales bacterium]MCB0860345.1 hypothetical protein [Solirubrobacterales bacterium]
MPSKYRRIAVVEDPELAEALRWAETRIKSRSDASLLRELAIRGAASLRQETPMSPGLRRILAIPGARPAEGDIRQTLRSRPPVKLPDGSEPDAYSRALDAEREERI